MPPSLTALPATPYILIVDDVPDVHTVTRLSLRGLRYRDREVKFMSVASGEEAVQTMRAHPEVGVILLDVVMESKSAGLDACRAIRAELGNRFVRILLRTGQPGAAPEKQTIDDYDIDGYLPKAELTTNRLYAAVRTALKGWEELVELERHRELLAAIHDSVVSLRSFRTSGNESRTDSRDRGGYLPGPTGGARAAVLREGGQSTTLVRLSLDRSRSDAGQGRRLRGRSAHRAGSGGPRVARGGSLWRRIARAAPPPS